MISSFESVFPSQAVLNALRKRRRPNQKIYLVGGVVRDALLGMENHDLDFVVDGDVRGLAKAVANELGAAFYMMNLEHQNARVVYSLNDFTRYTLDFTALQGDAIEQDLAARDFTINAMAVDIDNLTSIIDPLKGVQDLKDRRLRACSATAFKDDPIRLLRAVRHAVALQMSMDSGTIHWLKESSQYLSMSSRERQRDELMRILAGRKVDTAVRILDQFDLLEPLLPEVRALKNEAQPPHMVNAWEHTLARLYWLERLIDILAGEFHEEKNANLVLGMATLFLGRYRSQLSEHFNRILVAGRKVRELLFLAALLHDAGKPGTRTVDQEEKAHFNRNEKLGAEIANRRTRELGLSNAEIKRVERLVRQSSLIHLLAKAEGTLSRRSIYQYFQDNGESGIDLCFLALADTLAGYGVTILSTRWERELALCRQLMEAWFEQHDSLVDPPRLINGVDLKNYFQLQPGPLMGRILNAVREGQGAGEITTKEEALALAQTLIDRNNNQEEQ